jgi:hypothetical protein
MFTRVASQPRTASPNSHGSLPPKNAMGRHTATSQAPASPRVTCRSSFWAALMYGGLHKWINRAWENAGLSSEARASKHSQASSAITNVLLSADKKPTDWCARFKKVVGDAAWYEVKLDQEIDKVLTKMTTGQIKAVKTACKGEKSLNWLQAKVDNKLSADKKQMAIEKFEADLRIGYCKSAALVCEDYPLESSVQTNHWKAMDSLIAEVGDTDWAKKIGLVISKSNPWTLLPFAECHRNSSIASPTLEEFSRQAFKNLKNLKDIDFGGLTDVELDKFSKLVSDKALEHHTHGCVAELEKRNHTKKCHELASHLEDQLFLLVDSKNRPQESRKLLPRVDYFKDLAPHEISLTALQVITKKDPDVLVKLSKMESAGFSENWLIETAKATLKVGPNFKFLTDKNLIAFLKSTHSEISPEIRSKLKGEAKTRALSGIEARYQVLESGLDSDSWYRLVSAVKEFDTMVTSCEALETAADLDNSQRSIPEGFFERLKLIDGSKILRAKRLVDELRWSKEKQLSGILTAIFPDRKDVGLVPLNERDGRIMQKVLSHYFPASFKALKFAPTQQHFDKKLAAKLLDGFQEQIYLDSLYRKVRNAENEEIPVCATFVMDQGRSLQEINGIPVFCESGPEKITAASDFVRQMRNLSRISEAQIMMGSRVATQAVGIELTGLMMGDKLYPLKDSELKMLKVNGISSWIAPSGLLSKQNFVMNREGNLVAEVRIFNDNINSFNAEIEADGKTIGAPLKANPDNSYFSIQLNFEIDVDGEIKACILKDFAFAREVTGFLGS